MSALRGCLADRRVAGTVAVMIISSESTSMMMAEMMNNWPAKRPKTIASTLKFLEAGRARLDTHARSCLLLHFQLERCVAQSYTAALGRCARWR